LLGCESIHLNLAISTSLLLLPRRVIVDARSAVMVRHGVVHGVGSCGGSNVWGHRMGGMEAMLLTAVAVTFIDGGARELVSLLKTLGVFLRFIFVFYLLRVLLVRWGCNVLFNIFIHSKKKYKPSIPFCCCCYWLVQN
jgi:hypothetical protein